MVDMIIAYLKSNKDEIVDGINKKVNIPLVSEAKEEEIFDSLFDAVMEVLEAVLSKKK
jgi:nucleoid DNA-binding protein|tara:strand:- start:1451 stop:1624 length:174 start_codon:yes stop_codon:yes gene_type:complete